MGLSTGVMGLLGLGLGAANMVTSAAAAREQAQAQAAAAEWNAGISEDNARLQDIRAEQAREIGRHNVAVAKREGKLKIEAQRGAYAASGVKVDSGSALDVVVEQAGRNQYDQDMLEYNAELAAWGHNANAYTLRQQAAMTRATKQSSNTAMISSLLGGGASLFNQYQQYQYYFG